MWRRYGLLLALIVVVTAVLVGCSSGNNQGSPDPINQTGNKAEPQERSDDEAPIQIEVTPPEQVALNIVQLLSDKDMLRLAAFVNPATGIRFSPYGHIHEDTDVVFTAKQLEEAMTNPEKIMWGHYDGSGEPIELTFAEYFNRFVYSADFTSTDHIGYNEIIGTGNIQNNQKEVYPDSYIVEYYIPGDPGQDGMNWSSLRIVLDKVNDRWLCTAIIHDQWTI